MQPVSSLDHNKFVELLDGLSASWNAGDGDAFAASMTRDADFVTIRADHLHGREEIAISHRHFFSTIYAGSRNQITLDSAKMLGEGLALVHARSELDAPAGPLAGRRRARFSAVLTINGEAWLISSFHITLAPAAP